MSIDHQCLGLMDVNPIMCDVELMIIDLYKTWHTIFPEVWFTIGCERNGAEVITQRPWSNDCHATAADDDDTDDGDDDDGAKVKTQKPTIIIHLVTWLDFDKAFIFYIL